MKGKIMATMTDTHTRAFFEHHLTGQTIPYRDQVLLRCPFHDDRQASLSVNLKAGVWNCQAGCGKGGLVDFEMMASGCDFATARAHIASIVGADLFHAGTKAEAIYPYRDANNDVLFEKVRYPGKRFVQRRSVGRGYTYDLRGVHRPLYNLPEVVTANVVIIVEGEKEADNVTSAFAPIGEDVLKGSRVAVTTNFDGAGKWLEHYNPYFAGKKVIILPDNDDAGAKHAERVARAVHPYALGVRIVNLPGLDAHGDVSDYLREHSAHDLIAEIATAKPWYLPKVEQTIFDLTVKFVAVTPDEIDWLIEGVIPRGSNGMITASPKGGKSWAAIDMSIALALGEPWLGFRVPRPVRVALVSREDNPNLTAWRFKNLWRGRTAHNPKLIETNHYINTRVQSPQLLLDDEQQLTELMEAMRAFNPEFVIFDVFNVLHTADENDNSEMRIVLSQLSRIQAEIKCGIAVIHHFNKSETGSITHRLRGASSIAGWCEWVIGISMQDEATKTRLMEFDLKTTAADSPPPISYRIASVGNTTTLKLDESMPREAIDAERFFASAS
jgi:AAA domain/CHC2 zinc finger